MEDPHPVFHVAGVTLSDGRQLQLQPGEILLIVGPNNAGKSTFLRNIRSSVANSSKPGVMLKKVEVRATTDAIQDRLKAVFKIQEMGGYWSVLDKKGHVRVNIQTQHMRAQSLRLEDAAEAFVIQLNAETRLSLSKPVETLDLEMARPSHPYHHFMFKRDVLRKFAEVVRAAFGMDFTIVRIGNPIRGYVGPHFRNDEDALEIDQDVPRIGQPIEQQGDGIRSYVGIGDDSAGVLRSRMRFNRYRLEERSPPIVRH